MSSSLVAFADSGFAARPDAAAFLARTAPSLPERFAGSVAQVAPARHFSADSKIFAEGDAAVFYYKVVSGVIRSCKFLSDGRRQIDAFYVAGDVFGFEAGAEHGLSAEAVCECTVIPYRRRGGDAAAWRDAGMAQEMFAHVMHCLERTRAHCLLLGRASATQKLANFLLEMTCRSPDDEMVDLAMTRQDIADYLGLTIETVSRTLSQFERDGVIVLSTARRIRLKNRAALRSLDS